MQDSILQRLGPIRRPPSSLAVPSSANIRGPPPLGVGMEVRAVGKLRKNIFGFRIIAQGLESDVVNSDPVLAPGLSCPIVKWLKNPVPGSPWQKGYRGGGAQNSAPGSGRLASNPLFSCCWLCSLDKGPISLSLRSLLGEMRLSMGLSSLPRRHCW